ncbi:ParB family chromosome partitioning protein [Blastomonas natatoria]|uniref:ParB family chromosome partitioning protein n=1 Tax=Blastomonas natatoria TaxID=34015 RepID=A0A2V3V3M1_9SPHN|nr:ParB/RepB/Spo0J family partition protein [Blastomonas natatoria]PXW76363.1 ParB family chromosome partitioning protein [Blastomonas natatoria]
MAEDTGGLPDIAKALGRKRPSGLGRGLNALLGEVGREEPLVRRDEGGESQASPATGLRTLPLAEIRPHPGQPRRYFDEEALDDLARSIAQRGVIQPVIVRPRKGGGYELVAGERRWRAAQRARLHEIPAIVRELSDPDTLALALIENIQREDLNPVEEAEAYQRLVGDQGYSPVEVARMVDKSRSHIANLMRLLALPQPVLKMVADKSLSMGHARALINVPDAEAIAAEVVDRGLSVREVEKLVRRTRSDAAGKTGGKARTGGSSDGSNADIEAVERHLEDLLGLKVKITAEANQRSGAVTIRYGNLDQLDLICQRLSGEII